MSEMFTVSHILALAALAFVALVIMLLVFKVIARVGSTILKLGCRAGPGLLLLLGGYLVGGALR